MRLILLGPPGCGKGTQAQLLAARNHLSHIGTGDLLRTAADQQTPAGLKAKPYLDAGKLAPDEVVNDLVAERFENDDRPRRFVMDGYPRTFAQALVFDALVKKYKVPLSRVVLFAVADEEIVRRISGRRVCPKDGCKATYHIDIKPPRQPGVCDYCGTALVQRQDDSPEIVQGRLNVFRHQTEALVPYYHKRGLLRTVEGTGEIETIYANIMKALSA